MYNEGINQDIIAHIISFGAAYAEEFEPSKLKFSDEIREYCKENLCCSYDTNWMCPPAIGNIQELKKEVIKFENGIVFQTVEIINGKYDKKGMIKGRDLHNDFLKKVVGFIKEKYKLQHILPMGAGPCKICTKCAYLDGKKCRHPEKAVSSAEAYGIDLGQLLDSCDLKYNYSNNSIAYVGMILW
ncbi:DUF2284 domain-containing protein [Clostridium sp. MB40-C1]|uniref:DUF2284 domain-containing protein n=1 Tax=Clostridium sp. MB40-C1 TaxID=3070996 RepID=UPI0027E20C0A|nr:DUF2284 domain-containing protein [Clostridium sp. MB40-C1]WMJ79295.1 DUF2284 domain-containing protein [Clostridium sp. MB40-C1]